MKRPTVHSRYMWLAAARTTSSTLPVPRARLNDVRSAAIPASGSPALGQQDAQRRQAVRLLGNRAGLPCLGDGPLRDRARPRRTRRAACGESRARRGSGPATRRRAVRQQRHRLLAGFGGGMRVAGLPPVPPEPFQAPDPVDPRARHRIGPAPQLPIRRHAPDPPPSWRPAPLPRTTPGPPRAARTPVRWPVRSPWRPPGRRVPTQPGAPRRVPRRQPGPGSRPVASAGPGCPGSHRLAQRAPRQGTGAADGVRPAAGDRKAPA